MVMTMTKMAPPTEMLAEAEARQRILARIEPLPPAPPLPLLAAAGRFAAREIQATHALPGFDNSAMDGYAVACADAGLAAGTRLMVVGEQAAGADRRLRVAAGEAIRIFTGAPVPAGTGAIVMQEDVKRTGDQIVLTEAAGPGEYIRRAGLDVARGQRLVRPGEKLTAQRLGLLASQGLGNVEVIRSARVAILATGDELRPAGEPLGPGEIYESNAVLLAALVRPLGVEVQILESARDAVGDLEQKIAAGLAGHDVLIVAGGVSVGERDLVKTCLAALGVELELWRVRVQPGKPFLYGRHRPAEAATAAHGGAHVFGLPGNPVSAFVTFVLFVRPAILKLMGAADDALALPAFRAIAAADLAHGGTRPHYVRGILDADGGFTPAGRQESHALFGLSRSNALVRLEPESKLAAGSPVTAYVWDL
jgi:molybdopterin molybdotransferase